MIFEFILIKVYEKEEVVSSLSIKINTMFLVGGCFYEAKLYNAKWAYGCYF
jgi:hypothetical protein